MRRILTVLLTLVAILFAVALAGVLLPAVNKVQDLGKSGAGLELGEWQVSVGGCLLGSVLFTVLALSSRKTRFPTGFLTVSCLALLGFGAVASCLYSIKGRTGVVNQYGHGLTYGEWWASIIPWTIATSAFGWSPFIRSHAHAEGRRRTTARRGRRCAPRLMLSALPKEPSE